MVIEKRSPQYTGLPSRQICNNQTGQRKEIIYKSAVIFFMSLLMRQLTMMMNPFHHEPFECFRAIFYFWCLLVVANSHIQGKVLRFFCPANKSSSRILTFFAYAVPGLM